MSQAFKYGGPRAQFKANVGVSLKKSVGTAACHICTEENGPRVHPTKEIVSDTWILGPTSKELTRNRYGAEG